MKRHASSRLLTQGRDGNNREEVEALDADKDVELSIVAFTDAVVDPWAMVIEAIDADAAQIAMTAPWCADNRAVRAQAAGFKLIEQFDEVETRVTLQGAWVGEPDPEPKHHGKTEQALAAVEKPVREVAHSENVVRGELQEHKR